MAGRPVGETARKNGVWLDQLQRGRTDPTHPIQAGQRAKGTVFIAIRDNPRGKTRPNPWQSPDFFSRRDIQIDFFAALEWPCEAGGACGNGIQRRAGSSWGGSPVADPARRSGRPGGHPDEDTGNTEQQEEEQGTAIRRHAARMARGARVVRTEMLDHCG